MSTEVPPAPGKSPTASVEFDSSDSSDSEVELADPKESLRWLGYVRNTPIAYTRVKPTSRQDARSRDVRRGAHLHSARKTTTRFARILQPPEPVAHLPPYARTNSTDSSRSRAVADRSAKADSRGCV